MTEGGGSGGIAAFWSSSEVQLEESRMSCSFYRNDPTDPLVLRMYTRDVQLSGSAPCFYPKPLPAGSLLKTSEQTNKLSQPFIFPCILNLGRS